jgi:hypothetical protein
MLKTVVCLSTMLLLPCFAAPLRLEPRSVTGVVTDNRGNALSGAAVQLKGTISLKIMSYITGKDGRYYFNRLSANVDYTLTVKYRSHWSKPKTLSKFDSSKTPVVDLVVPVD